MTLLPFASGAFGEFASGVGVTEDMGGIETLAKKSVSIRPPPQIKSHSLRDTRDVGDGGNRNRYLLRIREYQCCQERRR